MTHPHSGCASDTEYIPRLRGQRTRVGLGGVAQKIAVAAGQ
jgi:hypothetical protein